MLQWLIGNSSINMASRWLVGSPRVLNTTEVARMHAFLGGQKWHWKVWTSCSVNKHCINMHVFFDENSHHYNKLQKKQTKAPFDQLSLEHPKGFASPRGFFKICQTCQTLGAQQLKKPQRSVSAKSKVLTPKLSQALAGMDKSQNRRRNSQYQPVASCVGANHAMQLAGWWFPQLAISPMIPKQPGVASYYL